MGQIIIIKSKRFLCIFKLAFALLCFDELRPGVLCLQNPDVLDHDVGRGAYMMPKIRRVFEQALQLLTVAVNDPNEFSFLCYFIRGDDPLLVQRLRK